MRTNRNSWELIERLFRKKGLHWAIAIGSSAFFFSLSARSDCVPHQDLVPCGGTYHCPGHRVAVSGYCRHPTGCAQFSGGEVIDGVVHCGGVDDDPIFSGQIEALANCCITTESASAESSTSSSAASSAAKPKATLNQPTHQEAAQLDAASLLGNTASQSITMGGLECLQGANVAAEKRGPAESYFEACSDNLNRGMEEKQKAEEAARRGGKESAALDLDHAILNGEIPQRILRDFQKNFKESGEDTLHKFFKRSEAHEAMAAHLEKKLSAEQAAPLLAAMEKGEAQVWQENGEKKAGGKAAVLREKLLAPLSGPARTDSSARSPRQNQAASEEIGLQSLTPLEVADFHEVELSLFDVVSRKYREKWVLLLSYLKKK